MIKNLIISLFISTLVVSSSYAAGSSDSGSSKTKTKYDMAVTPVSYTHLTLPTSTHV